MDLASRIARQFNDSAEVKRSAAELMTAGIADAVSLMTECLLNNGKILACGNGGSAADA